MGARPRARVIRARTKNASLTGVALVLGLATNPATAVEFGLVRPLQIGPSGDSPHYADFETYEAEAGVRMKRSWGKKTANDDSNTKISAASLGMDVFGAGGWMPSKNFGLSAYVDASLASDYDEEQKRSAPTSEFDSGPYEHELGLIAFYKGSPLVAGGGLALHMFGSETKELTYNGAKYTTEIGTAAMPVLRAFGGVMTNKIDATGGVRFFSKGEASVTAKDPTGTRPDYDITRRLPGELHADGRLKFTQGMLAASVSYVLSGQASEQVDEFSMQDHVNAGGRTVRDLGGARRNTDHARIAVGGRFQPNKILALQGSLSYIGASYAEERYASLEHENLGGMRLDIGGDVRLQQFRGFLHMGYLMDNTASYTVDNQSRAAAAIARTQKAPETAGDNIKLSQGSWSIAAGAGVAL